MIIVSPNTLILPLLLLLMSNQIVLANEADNDSVWSQLKKEHFGQRPIRNNATDLLFIEVPNKVEDAAIMPITIKSLAAQTADNHIKILHLIVDNNPQAYSAAFHLSPKLGAITLSTRIRMDNFSNVRIIAEMNDNSLHMLSRFVVAAGGCSAPASKDSASAAARLGEVQLRMRQSTIGQSTTAQMIVSHPNASGMQFNPTSREFIAAHYVTNIDISYNDEPLLTIETGITISEDPSIRFNFVPDRAGILKATITDSKQTVFTADKEIQ